VFGDLGELPGFVTDLESALAALARDGVRPALAAALTRSPGTAR
jgi:hypothetical protein